MKVKKLIELLQQQNPNAIVVLQEDREGNGHSPLGSVEPDGYVAMTKWNGDRKLLALTPELEEKGYTEYDLHEDAKPAVFLVPLG